MKRVYLRRTNCLAIFGQKADSQYWDQHWRTHNLRKFITSYKRNDFIMRPLRRYLPDEKGVVLEAGCGRAQNVYCMKHNGYNAIGVDFAEDTVRAVNEAVPELDVRTCDIRDLPFKDGEVAGYWSLGVIEHYWSGYEEILDEMERVVRRTGFLFLSFPYMSPLRRLKVLLDRYETRYTQGDNDIFYEYCLDHRQVLNELAERGFVLREKKPYDGIKGLKDEVSLFRPLLQQIYDGKICKGKMSRKIVAFLNKMLELFCAHGILFVMQRAPTMSEPGEANRLG